MIIWIIIIALIIILFVICLVVYAGTMDPNSGDNSARNKKKKQEIEKALIDSGMFKADCSSWISEIILSNIGKDSKAIDLAIRKHGEPISTEEKRQHGIRGNAKVSKEYLNSLTDDGKKDPIRSAFIVVNRILQKKSTQRIKANASASIFETELKFSCQRDDLTCEAALKMNGKIFPADEAPDLPLSDCDADFCRCVYLNRPKPMKRK